MFVEVVTIFLFLFIDDPSRDHDLQAVNFRSVFYNKKLYKNNG